MPSVYKIFKQSSVKDLNRQKSTKYRKKQSQETRVSLLPTSEQFIVQRADSAI